MKCPKTGKQIHADKAAAIGHVVSLRAKFAAVRMHPYRCEHCKGWHVGHRPPGRRKKW